LKTGIVIFSRFASTRLPGKALRPVAGRPLLGRVLDRARACEGADTVIVATSDQPADHEIAAFCATEGIDVFRGSHEDVLGRALACCRAHALDVLVRVTGDSPFIGPVEIDRAIERMRKSPDIDLVTNAAPRSFPVGMTVEAIRTTALDRAEAETSDPADREHITQHIYANPDRYTVENMRRADNDSGLVVAVDTEEDLLRAEWILARIDDAPANTDTEAVVALARDWESARA
jgi:spore coat polysaccharide biosynthesis protein SpsF